MAVRRRLGSGRFDAGIGHVPIGIVTDRDIVISVVAGDPDHVNYLLVSDVMSSDLVTASHLTRSA